MIHGLIGRISKDPRRYPNLSRDYDEIDCRATGCTFNFDGKCATPSRAKIGDDGRCIGFMVMPDTKKGGD